MAHHWFASEVPSLFLEPEKGRDMTGHRMTGTVLDGIIEGVVEDLAHRVAKVDRSTIERRAHDAPPPLDAVASLRSVAGTMAVIAEVKRASPSKGALSDIADPAHLAGTYAAHDAQAISVLTEQRRFRGSLDDLAAVRARVDTPVLRKDFIVDPYQIYEARAWGADLVLLMVVSLDDVQLRDFYQVTTELGMTALVEAHTPEEVDRALAIEPAVLGINARNLKTLEVDRAYAARLIATLPDSVFAVAESAVLTVDHVQEYADAGAEAILVGEGLVTSADPGQALRRFRSVSTRGRSGKE